MYIDHSISRLSALLVVSALFLAPGCDPESAVQEYSPRCASDWVRGPIDTTAEHHKYVVSTIEFATSPAEATTMGIDLDCVEPYHTDNALGQVLAAVYGSLDTDLNQSVADMVDSARIVHLIDIQTAALDNATNVGVQVFIGADPDGDASDNFSGVEDFNIVPSVASSAMAGQVADRQLVADLGDIPLQIALPGVDDVFVLELTATGIEAELFDDQLVARIGGALEFDQVENGLMPVMHTAITTVLENECPQGVCPAGSRGESILGVLDANNDGMVTFEEFRYNALVDTLLAPDVDLFDETGRFAPGSDGVDDSLSMGVLVTAVPAQF